MDPSSAPFLLKDLNVLKQALRDLRDAARAVTERNGWTKAQALDDLVAARFDILGGTYPLSMFFSAARDAVRSECALWRQLRELPDDSERMRCTEVARTIANRCHALLVNLGEFKSI